MPAERYVIETELRASYLAHTKAVTDVTPPIMLRLKIIVSLFLHTFSLRRSSLRFIHPKRVLMVLIMLPAYLVLFTLNWFFLLLDEILFPRYRRMEIRKAAFIISIPRSATTFLYCSLLKDRKHFHGFKLWELLFAPSVCQKLIVRAIVKADRYTGSPLAGLTRLADRLLFGHIRPIHDIGLVQHEEDEMLFLFNMSSLYLYYFFPGLRIMDKLLYHDTELPDKVRRGNVNYYHRMVQRHCYVFDPEGRRYFLSKNPTFIPKMHSIARRFPEARFIYPLRTPFETIPSTISLNAHVMSQFCHLPEPYPLQDETREFLLRWYIHAERVLREDIPDRHMVLPFPKIRDHTLEAFRMIYAFLGIPTERVTWSSFTESSERRRRLSRHQYDPDLGIDETAIIRALEGIVPAAYLEREPKGS